jgi:hypothetical protein
MSCELVAEVKRASATPAQLGHRTFDKHLVSVRSTSEEQVLRSFRTAEDRNDDMD